MEIEEETLTAILIWKKLGILYLVRPQNFQKKTITSYPLLKLMTSLTVISEAATGGVLKNLERFTGKHLSEPLFY